MSVVIGGDILEMSFVDSVIGTGFFYPMKGEDNTFIPGGFENEDNGAVDGAGRLVVTQNRNVGSLQVVLSNGMNGDNPELELAKALQSTAREQTWTISHSNGEIYKGKGIIVGSLELNTNKATFQMKIVSGLGFERQ